MGTPLGHAQALASFVQVRARYRRAVNLERDTGRLEALKGYLVTRAVRRALVRIHGGLVSNATERAWSVTGPYGSGKTAFAVFLSDLMRPGKTSATSAARTLLKEIDPRLAQAIRKIRLHPVVLTGERAPLDFMLVRALRGALEAIWSTRRGAKPSVLNEASRLVDRLAHSRNGCVSSEVVQCFEKATQCLVESSGAGLLLIVDETGKILEYAAQQPTRGDIHLLQALAELAASSGRTPFVIVTVLHQAFEQYANRLSVAQRNEWAKVQGRFSDLVFQEEADQLLRLVASALEPIKSRPALTGWRDLVKAVATWVGQATGWDEKAVARNLDRCWPLHPMTAVLLGPLFRGRLAQNERSLFAFLSSGEPLGFHEFLRTEKPGSLYTPDRLYDYVLATLGSRLFGQDGRLWAEIDTALRRLPPESNVLDAKVLKVSGILSMLGDQVGLRSSVVMLARALGDESGMQGAIQRLETASLLVYRKFRDAYQIWEGSDLNLDKLVAEALSLLPPDRSLASLLNRLTPPHPIIARRHLFRTGTLRYFEVRFVDGEHLQRGLDSLSSGVSDGTILLALPSSDEAGDKLRKLLEERMISFTGPGYEWPVVVTIPTSVTYLSQLTNELAALEWVQTNTSALQADPVVRKELTSRLAEIHLLLQQEVSRVFAADNAECKWYTREGKLQVRSSRELVRALSDLFDVTYSKAPAIRNELLNRRELSSAAAKARRNLLEAMILHRHEHRLGFVGYPPEVSMYRSLLEEHGLHRLVDGRWRFVAPDGVMRDVWHEIECFFVETEARRLPMTTLYERLRRPPFGIKEGPLPVLVCAVLLSHESDVAIYEQGSLVPELSPPVIERLLRWPDRFELRQCRIAGVRLEVFERLARSLMSDSKSSKTILDVVRSLMKFIATLPGYTRNTSTLSEEAARVREALIRAREPAQLLFHDLPLACGCSPFELSTPVEHRVVEIFLSTLRRSLSEMQNAYPQLLTHIEKLLSQTLGLPASDHALRIEMRTRAQQVLPLAVESRLRGLLVRAIADGLEHEEWLVSLATYIASRPPAEWTDRDRDQFQVQLALVARQFRSIEVLALAAGTPSDGTKLLRVAIAQQGATEREGVVAVRSKEMPLLALLREQIMATVRNVSANVSRNTAIAALALAIEHLLAEIERTDLSSLEGRRE